MTRGLFFSFFIRMTIALAFVAVMRVWFTPNGWILGSILVVGWAAINAFLLSRVGSQEYCSPSDRHHGDSRPAPVGLLSIIQYSDFDGLAQAISRASGHVERVLTDASESRREFEAMIDSMQDAVVAVDQAGRIQWTNQRMQKLIPERLRQRLCAHRPCAGTDHSRPRRSRLRPHSARRACRQRTAFDLASPWADL